MDGFIMNEVITKKLNLIKSKLNDSKGVFTNEINNTIKEIFTNILGTTEPTIEELKIHSNYISAIVGKILEISIGVDSNKIFDIIVNEYVNKSYYSNNIHAISNYTIKN